MGKDITSENLNRRFKEHLRETGSGKVVLDIGVSSPKKLMNSVAYLITDFFKANDMGATRYDSIDYSTITFTVNKVPSQKAVMFKVFVSRKEVLKDSKKFHLLEAVQIAQDDYMVPEEIRGMISLNNRYKYMMVLRNQIDSGLTNANRVITSKEMSAFLKKLNKHDLTIKEFENLIRDVNDMALLRNLGGVPNFLNKLDELIQSSSNKKF